MEYSKIVEIEQPFRPNIDLLASWAIPRKPRPEAVKNVKKKKIKRDLCPTLCGFITADLGAILMTYTLCEQMPLSSKIFACIFSGVMLALGAKTTWTELWNMDKERK